MEIIVRLDEIMARRKIRLHELAAKIGITEANLSILKNDKAKAIRFSTLAALCKALECQPGDLLEYISDNENISAQHARDRVYATKEFRMKGIKLGMLIGCIISTGSCIMTSGRELPVKTIYAVRDTKFDRANITYDYQLRKLNV